MVLKFSKYYTKEILSCLTSMALILSIFSAPLYLFNDLSSLRYGSLAAVISNLLGLGGSNLTPVFAEDGPEPKEKAEKKEDKADALKEKAEKKEDKADALKEKAEKKEDKAKGEEDKDKAKELKGEAKELKSEAKELKGEAKELKSEAKELKGEARDSKEKQQKEDKEQKQQQKEDKEQKQQQKEDKEQKQQQKEDKEQKQQQKEDKEQKQQQKEDKEQKQQQKEDKEQKQQQKEDKEQKQQQKEDKEQKQQQKEDKEAKEKEQSLFELWDEDDRQSYSEGQDIQILEETNFGTNNDNVSMIPDKNELSSYSVSNESFISFGCYPHQMKIIQGTKGLMTCTVENKSPKTIE